MGMNLSVCVEQCEASRSEAEHCDKQLQMNDVLLVYELHSSWGSWATSVGNWCMGAKAFA